MRELFPQLSEQVYGKPLVYLDNAATALRPQSVIDYWTELSSKKNANLHRAVHHIAELATNEYESARDCVKNFLNAKSREEIIFTSGTTSAINLVAFSFGEAFIKKGDEIIVSEAEHHSNIVPWQMLCERKGAVLKHLEVDDNGQLLYERLEDMITPRTRIVCVTHVSNVLGIVNPIKDIVTLCHSKGCAVLADGAQGVVHANVDVRAMGCDFYVFSGHKIYSAPGVGVLYGRKELLERMPPYMGGGEMIGEVKWSGTTYAPLPQKFEAGTQNMAGVPTLVPALRVAEEMKESSKNQLEIRDYVLEELQKDKRIKLYGAPDDAAVKIPLFSFVVNGAHHEDLALILDKMGIAVRSGQMCAEPLMDRFNVTGMLRASFAPYNTMEEAEYFIKSLDRAIKMLV
ncbi:MAG: SufS family cysteine desulfurase [Bacteroidales bacterium]|nr:SufS family cysteine desulfurase [Bacteroidales bacterium]